MSKPNDEDRDVSGAAAGDAAEEAAAEIVSGRPGGPRFRDVAVLVPKEYLDRLLESRAATDAEPTKPTTPDELRAILLEVDKLGWQWTADSPPALSPKTTSVEPQPLADLSREYPAIPEELAELVKYVLWGWKPSQRIVGPPSDLPAKASIVSELLLTEDYRSAFFFENSTRLRRFYDLDWEIMVKTAERDVNRFPGAAYATIVLETKETQPDFEEQTDSFLFAVDARAIRRMIETLQGALKALERAKVMAHEMRHEEGGAGARQG